MEKSQREYYLNEQVKAIQKELGELEEGADLDEIDKKIKKAGMPKEARAKAEAGSPRKSMPILSTSSSRNSGLRTATLDMFCRILPGIDPM